MDDETKRHLKDYEATTDYFKTLVDVRFKLLLLLPLATGGGVALLGARTASAVRLPLSLFGLIVSLALAFYDQRNTEIYDALKMRAKELEQRLGFASGAELPGRWIWSEKRSPKGPGGAFRDRPLECWLFSHTTSLALIYGAVIGTWVYPLAACFSLLKPRAWIFALGAGTVWFVVQRFLLARPKDEHQPPGKGGRVGCLIALAVVALLISLLTFLVKEI